MTLVADAPARTVDPAARWRPVCPLAALQPERGVAALVGGAQVALFLLDDGTVRAVQQADPYAGANVMSRGLVGTWRGRASLASPMHKQVFDLETGACLDAKGADERPLRAYPARVVDGVVEVAG